MKTEALYQAVLSAFNQQRAHIDDDAAAARAFTDILVAFAALIAPPAFEAVAGELVADDTPKLILAELQRLTALADRLEYGQAALAIRGSVS